ALEEQVGRLEERAPLGQLLDRVAAVQEHAGVAVDVRDAALARGRVAEGRIVDEEARGIRLLADLLEVHGAYGAVLDRDLVLLARAVVGDGQGVRSHGQSSPGRASAPARAGQETARCYWRGGPCYEWPGARSGSLPARPRGSVPGGRPGRAARRAGP